MTERSRQVEEPSVTRARDIILEHGWNSTSFQIVNPGIARWFPASNDAVIGYVTADKVRVVVGAPVCAIDRLESVVAEFESEARLAGEHVCYFAAESRLESLVGNSGGHTRFRLGAQPFWDPRAWSSTVSTNRSLRAQLNRARNKHVTVSEWPIEKAERHPQLSSCLDEWLGTKGLPPLHFMVEPDTLARLAERRVFVAELAAEVVGFVVISPIKTRNGWLFEQFPHRPTAPNGTVELMIDGAMHSLAADGSEYATLGLSPLSTRANLGPIDEPAWLRILLIWLRKHCQRFYNFDGLDAFKAKLRPVGWEAVFAVSNESRVSFRTLYAITSAFSGNRPLRMVIGGLARAAATEMRWLKRRLARR